MSKRRFYGQFNPPVDQYLFERFFPTLRGGISLKCGAYDGIQESSCYFFERYRGWHAVNVEAAPPIYQQLQRNRPKSINVHAALSNRTGLARFTHVISPKHGENFGNGSLTHHPCHQAELVKEGCRFVDFEVRTLSYPELIAEIGLTSLDLLVLDVEGHEQSVIEGMSQGTLLPSVLCVEHGHLGQERIRELLAGLPFRFDSSLHVNSFFINELNPPPKTGFLRRTWGKLIRE